MGIGRQLPILCIRGSIANLTMANLDEAERWEAERLTKQICDHEEMQAKRQAVNKMLARTIGQDYRDDRAVADEEYQIAVWRGVVNILYHRKYDFRCTVCQSSHYITTRGKPALIDYQREQCPHCGMTIVADPGEIGPDGKPLSGLEEGQVISHDDFQASYAHFGYDHVTGSIPRAPVARSPIEYIVGSKMHEDPYSIIDDPIQMKRFFGEYVWNYFRQQIKENKRAEETTVSKIVGRADEIIVGELLALCEKLKIEYADAGKSGTTLCAICLAGVQTPPEFTVELVLLRQRAADAAVTMRISGNEIVVLENSNAGNLTSVSSKKKYATYQENGSGGDDDDGATFSISHVAFRTIGGVRMDQEDHVATIETNDVMEAIRGALPEGDCRRIFDIESGLGSEYELFSGTYGDSAPRKIHIAKHLGITPRAVGAYRDTIKLQMLAHGLVPCG